ncbi:MAG TPA: CpaF family protein [Balneolales bacterium]|nr:CpaF family protein [Balneolales bacterium]
MVNASESSNPKREEVTVDLPINLEESFPMNSERFMPEEYFELKTKIHNRLLDLTDLSIIETLDHSVVRSEIRGLIERILSEEENGMPLNLSEREKLFSEILDEVLGLGPLEPFLQDPKVSDILVNTYKQIYLEKRGKLELTHARFKDDDHLMKIIDKIVSSIGRRIDESSPMVDARLPDGSRVNAIIPPLAIDGPMLSIRRFAADPLELEDLIEYGTLITEIGEILKAVVKARLNIIISGGTGSGKTTLLNVLSRFIPIDERIVTIEDAAELQLKQEHVIRLETKPANIEGKGQIAQRDLLRNSLRMRPDRIILGEVRGQESFDMLQAMNTGHDGSLTTIHANSPRDALMRLETMVAMAKLDIPSEFIRRYISSAIDIIIHTARLADGKRKILSFQEITGMEGNVMTLQEIFSYRKEGIDQEGKVEGNFEFHGVRPNFMEKLKIAGIQLPQMSQ